MNRREREAAIYQAAARVFRRKGLKRVRLQDVAEEAGIPRGALYYYVASKADLIWTVIETPLCHLLQQARNIVNSTANPETKLAQLIEHHLCNLITYHESWLLLQCEDLETLQQTLTINLEEVLQQYEACWQAVIEEGKQQKTFTTISDPERLASAYISLVQGVYCWGSLKGKQTPEAVAAWLTPLVLGNLQKTAMGVSASVNA
ncbi:TetR/AcrR family transcriptional regulator [Rhodothermus profundi]|uniref:Transcriptional regulator, TetR family n=1 Tax=Rhodothermus profundi TaxID=633813 RepID=A0A1M6QAB1_9BACT|nr:TetR/AcrR family transcriptional regulator [Rhodothermus profundi]SHK17182.1 transcriptional regulator, TetR family [Rhodothermus profundi]